MVEKVKKKKKIEDSSEDSFERLSGESLSEEDLLANKDTKRTSVEKCWIYFEKLYVPEILPKIILMVKLSKTVF